MQNQNSNQHLRHRQLHHSAVQVVFYYVWKMNMMTNIWLYKILKLLSVTTLTINYFQIFQNKIFPPDSAEYL